MPISVSAQDVVVLSGAKEAPLRVQVSPDGGTIDTITLIGLSAKVKVIGGEKKDEKWVIPHAALPDAKLELEKQSDGLAQVEVEVSGNRAGKPEIVRTKFQLAVLPERAPSKFWAKVLVLILLLLITIPVFVCWHKLYQRAQKIMTDDHEVVWAKPTDVWLKAGPTTFWYEEADLKQKDKQQAKLHHRGPIDAKLKLQLLALARVDKTADKTVTDDDRRLATYISAIDELTYKSNKDYSRYFLYLLTIAGLSGVLGTQLRSLANFVYIATIRPKDFDVSLWWPWYIVRPIAGFLLGLLAVLLVEARIYSPETESTPSGTVWWMGMAMLVGFAADGFSQRLRLVTQALFGEEKKKDKEEKEKEKPKR